jgi:hypothetical protein
LASETYVSQDDGALFKYMRLPGHLRHVSVSRHTSPFHHLQIVRKFVQLILFSFYPVVKHYIIYYIRRVDPSIAPYILTTIVMSSITKSSNSNFQQNMSSSPPITHAMPAHPQGGYNPSAIQAWTQSLPSHTVSSGRSQHADDAAVQAYLQAKMALFSRH